ncbi:ESPR-type extended signal peptide-containing protein [Acidaminococcus massiliensis]|uniref:ESPR-type extended signal peptide-containing protein n=1 Tax=Acidaminococcus massiliensis TaxID=1852375 RepID=UPI00094EB4E9|nr:ESPR-type extended signal peptide-containing protein [Acidaminococcus massiliensis]
MNKIYKVIWSRAKNCYVVVSELAGSHVKNNSGNRTKVLASAVLTVSLLASFPADSLAADTATGAGTGVAYGTGSNAPKAENVAIGKGATISYQGGVGQPSTGDIAIGGGARTLNYIDQGGGIAIGMNAFVENMVGGLERSFDFNQAGYNSIFGIPYGLPKDPTKMVTGLAIGQNTYARSGSVMLGTHNYKGALGDITVDTASTKSYNMSLFSTTLGANSFSNGLFSSITGAYSIASSDYNTNTLAAGKNFGATITGALNSIESATASSSYAGVANSIVGTANREFNSNGALIFGAGNEITNSITDISAPTSSGDSAQALQKTLMASVKKSESGGATLAIGGGNKADYTQKTSIIGVNNTVTGTSGSVSRYNMVNGYKNTASNVQHVSVIGSGNTVKDTDTALLLGDNRTLSGATNSLVIGSADNVTTTDQQNVVVLGHNANATVAGGVALGSESLAAVEAGFAGYDPSTRQASTDTSSAWVATGAAVSVGKGTELTRQITSVAAGTQDTDAVNVAQLKQALQAAEANDSDIHVKAGEYAVGTVQNQAGSNVQGVALDLVDKAGNAAGKVIITDVAKASDVGDLNYVAGGTGTQGKVVTNGDTVTVAIGKLDSALNQATAEAGKHSIVSAGDNISVQNTAGAGEAANYQVSLKKDITVDSVTAQTASVGGIQLNQGNSGTIGGLQNTTWDPDQIVSGQAATEDQLKAVTANVVSYDDASHSSITLNQGGSSTVIKNVGDGSVAEGSKEAVNGGQLYRTNQAVEKNAGDIRNLGSSVNKLGSRLNRVGAGAAALAALHPQDFDPDDKWDFAAGYGNYKDAHAAAIGAFYRPSEDTLISVGGSFGGGENMVNAGVTFKLGQHNHVTRSKVAMAKEIIDLRATVEMLKNQNAQILQTLKLQGTPAVKPLEGNFSDVPETHWAYQYVEGLRERGYLQGYPDGEFKGDRTMTRYEYAAIIYRALQNGAPVDAGMARSVEEFKPELTQVQEAERFRVDRISGKDNDRHKVERVRVNSKENREKKEYRDVYGSRIQRDEK